MTYLIVFVCGALCGLVTLVPIIANQMQTIANQMREIVTLNKENQRMFNKYEKKMNLLEYLELREKGEV